MPKRNEQFTRDLLVLLLEFENECMENYNDDTGMGFDNFIQWLKNN